MTAAFYVAAVVAVLATAMVIVQTNAVHALLYLVVSLLAVAIVFYVLGAPFAAALEVIVYAGAIMVLFVFVIMMLNLGEEAARQERQWLTPGIWIGPALLSAVLLGELVYMLWQGPAAAPSGTHVTPRQVGALFFGPYVLAVELASLLLLAGLIGAYHLGRQERRAAERDAEEAREERDKRGSRRAAR
jgi:NADH-quinone oxidoreductase subunit J